MKYVLIIYILYACSSFGCSGHAAVDTGMEGQPLPAFNLLLMDSTTRVNTKDIPYGKPIVLFFMTPYCPYCQKQAKDIISKISSFGNTQFYILSSYPFSTLKTFYTNNKISSYPNVKMGQDYESFFPNHFKVKRIPYLAVYNKEKRLERVLVGNVGTETIKEIALK